MKTKLIAIILVCLVGILMTGVLHWYFNYQLAEGMPRTNTEETAETGKGTDENIKSIPLEKPPFIK